jgi:uncharacterized membrane protein
VARRRLLLAALRALLVIAGVMPWIFALAGARPAELVLTFHMLCHQLPERTLSLRGAEMLVCSRCAGLYAGVALGALLPLPKRLLPWGRRFVVFAIAAAIVDVVTQDAGLHPPFHPVRLATGFLMGFCGTAFMCGAICEEGRVEKLTKEPPPWCSR